MGRNSRLSLLAGLAVTILAACDKSAAQSAKVDRRLIVSVPDNRLAVVENGQLIKVYRVATGAASSPSPSGSFRVVNRLTSPTYYTPGKVVAPGPQNPLGSRWIGLDQRGYGIHGTNAPKSIGKAASHGCIRMAKRDLEELFARVRVGDVVEIHAERDAAMAALFGAPSSTPAVVAQTATPADRLPGGLN